MRARANGTGQDMWFACQIVGGQNEYLNGDPDPIKEIEEDRQLAGQTTLQKLQKTGFVARKTEKNGLN